MVENEWMNVNIYMINSDLPFFTACLGMDVTVSNSINALNGTTVRIPCIFTSCYKIDVIEFNMNWTYQESFNHTEQKVKLIVLFIS